MAMTIRLKRVGKRGMPYYRIVVLDSRKPRDGTTVEMLGIYHPLEQPTKISLDEDKALQWLRKGARPTDTVRSILSKQGILAKFAAEKQITKKSAKRSQPNTNAEQAEEASEEPRVAGEEQ